MSDDAVVGASASKWFVVVRDQQGRPHPMTEDDEGENVALFTTDRDAERAGGENMFGAACGYEVYEWTPY